MAKGFTVKAKTPTVSEPEWDYNLAREMVKGKSVVFCLPGRGVSYTYLKSFVQLCFDLASSLYFSIPVAVSASSLYFSIPVSVYASSLYFSIPVAFSASSLYNFYSLS